MQCCRAKLEGAEHFVHHTHFAGSQSRRMGRHQNTGARRFLSQLKADCTEFNDLPFRYCTEQLQIFAENDAELLFVHIREPEEIERFRQTAGVNCKTILVRRPTLEQARGQLATAQTTALQRTPMMRNSSTTVRWRNCPQKYTTFYRL